MKRRIFYWIFLLTILVIPLLLLHNMLIQFQDTIEGRKPSFLLITLDTCREDALGVYGNDRTKTPYMDFLATLSVTFIKGYAPIPTTGPSHTTLLTGLDPKDHKVFSNGVFYRNPQETLTEILTSMGYQTAAFISGYSLVHRVSGLGRGFSVYDDKWSEFKVERSCEETTAAALNWLNMHAGGPFFLWVHYFDPHSPYSPGSPYDRFWNSQDDNEIQPQPSESVKIKYDQFAQNALEAKDFGLLVKDPATVSASDDTIQRLRALYDAEVARTDRSIGVLLASLQQKELYTRTNIFLTADHGEGFEKNYYFAHGDRLWESAVRVPWLVKFRQENSRNKLCSQPALHRDFFPTVLKMAGFPYHLPGIDGDNLEMMGIHGLPRKDFSWFSVAPPLPRKQLSQGLLISAYDPRFKMIVNISSDEITLFDLIRDPAEISPISAPPEKITSRMNLLINQIYQEGGFPVFPTYPDISEDDAGKLKQLGYLE